ncbi:protease III [Escherichia coli]|uniref:Protease III n=1 Tax=Escherichia coli TaxID=562 RepID=A0A376TTU8_ECOLX|nr:protease III [Escherichia coli]
MPVNAELTMARTRDGMRMAQVSAETINPAHPGSKFSGGNLETLSDKPGNPVQQAPERFPREVLFRQSDEGGYLQQ